jgi:hypothetical protein
LFQWRWSKMKSTGNQLMSGAWLRGHQQGFSVYVLDELTAALVNRKRLPSFAVLPLLG